MDTFAAFVLLLPLLAFSGTFWPFFEHLRPFRAVSCQLFTTFNHLLPLSTLTSISVILGSVIILELLLALFPCHLLHFQPFYGGHPNTLQFFLSDKFKHKTAEFNHTILRHLRTQHRIQKYCILPGVVGQAQSLHKRYAKSRNFTQEDFPGCKNAK